MLQVIDDYLVEENEMKWIGICMKTTKGWIYILHENVHEWLIPFHKFFIGFR